MKKFSEPIYVTRPVLPDRAEFGKSIDKIFESQWLTNMGAFHQALEGELKGFLGVPHVSLFNNGAIALLVALKALSLPKNSEVITTPFTFAATPHVVAWNGLRPVFADIDRETFTLDPEAVRRAITPNTSAILGVHVFGFPCHVDALEAIAKEHGLQVVYDGAHAFSTKIGDRSIGRWGALTMLSFHATKLFNSLEGGALLYDDPALEQRIKDLRNFGIRGEFEVSDIGINGKMNEVQAAFGLLNLRQVAHEQALRAEIHALYRRELATIPGLTVPNFPSGVSNSYQYFPILVKRTSRMSRDVVYDRLREANVWTRKYFYPLCSTYVPYRELPSSAAENLPVANSIADEVLCLPFYGHLGLEAAGEIASMIREVMS